MNTKVVAVVGLSRFTSPSGICRYASNIIKMLDKIENVEVIFIIGTWQKAYFDKAFGINQLNISVRTVSIPNNSIMRNIWFLFMLPWTLASLKVNILFLTFPIPFVKSFVRKIKVITTVHDMYAFELPDNFRFPLFNRLFTSISLNGADLISSVSEVTTKKVKNYWPKLQNKLKTIYTPFSFTNISPSDEKDIVEKPYFLCVAQHRKNKNLDVLVKAFDNYKKTKNVSDILIIIGNNGPETVTLMRIVGLLESKNDIVFKNNVSENELIHYYLRTKCFVLLSSTEGLGIPLIESLYLSDAVICTDIEVFKEIDVENCNFVPRDKLNPTFVGELMSGKLRKNQKKGIIDSRFLFSNILKTYKNIVKEN